MAELVKTVVLRPNRPKQLHLSVATRFSVEIIEGRDSVLLVRRLNGVRLDPAGTDDFTFLTAGQCVPWGTVQGNLGAGATAPLTVRYKVRSGKDFTGVPEFEFRQTTVTAKAL